MNLCFEDELSNKSMNFILLSLIVAIVTTNLLEEKACAVMGERCKKFSCKGRMIVFDAEMARVASVERRSCLPVSFASTQCEKHGLCGKRSWKETAHFPSWNKVVH